MDGGLTRTIVTFYPSEGAPFTEEFITNVQPTGTRVVTDAEGRMKLAGARNQWVTPEQVEQRMQEIVEWQGKGDPPAMYEFERETFEVDIAAQLTRNIERFLTRQRDDGTTNAERIEAGLLRGSRVDRRNDARVLPEPAPHLRTEAVRAIAGKEVDVPVDRARVEVLKRERRVRD